LVFGSRMSHALNLARRNFSNNLEFTVFWYGVFWVEIVSVSVGFELGIEGCKNVGSDSIEVC